MHAEEHYQFRHAVMRDAAYLLHPLTLRGTLHRVALELYESELAIDLPEPAEKLRTQPLPVDSLTAQLATHARYAQDEPYANLQVLRESETAYLTRAGNHAERQYDHAQAISLWVRLAEISDGIIHFWALQRASQVCRSISRLDEGRAISERALEFARRELAEPEIVLALAELGLSTWIDEMPKVAQAYLEEALGLVGPNVPKALEANTLGLLGMVYVEFGRAEEAESLCLRALALLREAGDKLNEGVLLQNMGGMMLNAGRIDDAERYLKQATNLHTEINDDTNQGIGLNNLAMLETHRSNYKLAVEYAERAMPLLIRVGSRRSLAYSYNARAFAFRRAGALERAKADTNVAMSIHREAGNVVGVGDAMCEQGLIELEQGNPAKARELWLRGAAVLRSVRGADGANAQATDMRETCAKAGVEPFE